MSPERVADQAHEFGAPMDNVSFGSSQVLDYQREFEHFHGLLQKKNTTELNSNVRFMNIVLINSPLQKQQCYYIDHIPVSLHDL